jgi:phosphoribosyl 1,2-cyclic phosphodiesterase
VRYGGNTSCVELRSEGGTLLVFDCGTGARLLGQALVEASDGGPVSGSLVLGHTHWDHIQGLPFFEPLFGDGHWDVYGPRGVSEPLHQTLAGQMTYPYFPVSLQQLGAGVEYHELVEGTFEIADVVVRTQYLNHPALTLGYRIECDGAVVCYVTDHEPFDPALGAGGDVIANRDDARHVEFVAGADLVIHDAQYTASEYPSHVGWGHSPVDYVVDVCSAADVGRTVLFHHDPSHDDDTLDAMVEHANRRADGRTDISAAVEGDVLEASSATRQAASRAGRVAMVRPALEEVTASILVITQDDALRAAVTEAARAEGLPLLDVDHPTADGVDDGRLVVVADLDQGSDALDEARSALPADKQSRLGVLAVTRTLGAQRYAPADVTDWLVWPASVAHVRTKLKSAVLRRACRWLAAPLPADEERRLDALYALDILDTEAEEPFDRFTRHACERFGVPIALITLVDRDRQWFKSRVGIDLPESTRDQSFCAHTILGPDVMQVPDAVQDSRFAENPAAAAFHIRFYAGAPLTLADGSRIGTLCIADHRPRHLDADDVEALRDLAGQVVALLRRG